MFGEKGKSDEMLLDSSKNNFERASVDKFSHVGVDIGKLTKVNFIVCQDFIVFLKQQLFHFRFVFGMIILELLLDGFSIKSLFIRNVIMSIIIFLVENGLQ
jgi:hypothetical protein